MSQLDAQMYRERAAQCLALAERAQRDDDKATWLELAGKWQRLAEEAASRGRARQQQQPPQMAVRRRQIEEADLGAVAELFARGFLLRSKSYWLRGFARLRSRSVPAGYSRYGLLLESEGRPVGAILTIYASVPADGAFAIRCNVSS